MKIPAEIIGKNKLRDFDICLLYISGLTPEEIKEKRSLSITLRRVQKIVYDNAVFINPRIGWSKSKRIHRLQKWLQEREDGGKKTTKDVADLLEQIRREIEGDKPLVDNSTHQTFNVRWKSAKESVPRMREDTAKEALGIQTENG